MLILFATITCLQQIHSFIFGGLYDFAGKIRTKNIAKDNFQFTPAQFLDQTLKDIEKMPLSWLLKNLQLELEFSIHDIILAYKNLHPNHVIIKP